MITAKDAKELSLNKDSTQKKYEEAMEAIGEEITEAIDNSNLNCTVALDSTILTDSVQKLVLNTLQVHGYKTSIEECDDDVVLSISFE